MSGPVMDEDGFIIEEGNGGGGGYYCLDDGNCFSSSSSCDSSDSDSDSDSAGCCCDGWEDDCCFEMVECCGGGGRGGGMGGCVLGVGPLYGGGRSCGVVKRDGVKKRVKEKGKKKKKGKKGGSLWQRWYPVRKRGDWGGDVVGVSRCPGEQDPKKWGFKIDHHHHPQAHTTPRVVARHVCAPGSCYHDDDDDDVHMPRPRSRDRVVFARRSRPRTRGDRHDVPMIRGRGDECTTHPRRGRRRTLLFDEYEAYPRGDYYEYLGTAATPPREDTTPARLVRERSYTPTRIVRESGSRRRRWGRRREEDDDDERDGMTVMHGALVDDGDRRGGYGGRRRERSWERRSDPDDRIGEIDDRTEHSYVMGERMAAVPRREDPGRRMVRFHQRS